MKKKQVTCREGHKQTPAKCHHGGCFDCILLLCFLQPVGVAHTQGYPERGKGPRCLPFFIRLGPTLRPRASPDTADSAQDDLADQIQADLEAGHLERALSKAHEAVGQFPRSSELQQLLGATLFKKGLNEEARTAFRRAIELDPHVSQNYFDLALVDLAEHRYPDAAKSLEACLRLAPQNAQAHLLLGRAYHNQNQTLPAIEQFQRALNLDPKLPLAHYHLGFALQSMGNLAAALSEYNREFELNPAFPDAHWLAGDIELKYGDLKGAEKSFREGIRLKPQAYQAHYGLARVCLARHQYAEAEMELADALHARPDDAEIHYALAHLYQQTGRKDAANREFGICASLHAQEQKRGTGIAGAIPQP